jgi:PAS domain-containing protein
MPLLFSGEVAEMTEQQLHSGGQVASLQWFSSAGRQSKRAGWSRLRNAAERLRPNGEFRHGAFENLNVGGILASPDGRYLAVNAACLAITGHDRNSLLSHAGSDDPLIHTVEGSDGLLLNETPLSIARETASYDGGPVYIRHAEGYMMPVTACALALRGADGRTGYLLELFSNAGQFGVRRQLDYIDDPFEVSDLTWRSRRSGRESALRVAIGTASRGRMIGGVLHVRLTKCSRILGMVGQEGAQCAIEVVGETLRACLRSNDHVIHWRDDCFLCVLRMRDAEELNRLRMRLAALLGLVRFFWWGREYVIECGLEGMAACHGAAFGEIISWASRMEK